METDRLIDLIQQTSGIAWEALLLQVRLEMVAVVFGW